MRGRKIKPKRLEKLVIGFCEENIGVILTVVATLGRLAICYWGRKYESGDYIGFLLPWFKEIQQGGGWKALGHQVGNYNMTYQFLIAIMSYVPWKPLYLYKSLSIIFDFALAGVVAKMVESLLEKKSTLFFSGVYTMVLFCPTTWMNSAIWAQCDSMYVVWVIIALLCLYKDKPELTFGFLGIAFACKLQTIFIIPFIIFYYALEKKFSVVYFIEMGIIYYLMCLPGLLQGRDIWDPIMIYKDQTVTYKAMQMNFPSFWVLVGDNYEILKNIAIVTTVMVLGIGLGYAIYRQMRIDTAEKYMLIAVWTVWTCLNFLPSMHERYSYMLDILLIVLVTVKKDYWLIAAVEILISILKYSICLFGSIDTYHIEVFFYLGAWLMLSDKIYRKINEADEKK